MHKIFPIIPFLIIFCFIDLESFAQTNKYTGPSIINLAGKWGFMADPRDDGLLEKWYNQSLKEAIILPGSMAENGKGNEITLQTPWTGSIYDSSFYFSPRLAKYRQPGNVHIPFWLTPSKHYVGAAWYQKEVVIPQNWQGKRISLFLERCHWESRVWVNEKTRRK